MLCCCCFQAEGLQSSPVLRSVSSYLGAKRSILVHENEGMRVPTAARGYEWMVICELAC